MLESAPTPLQVFLGWLAILIVWKLMKTWPASKGHASRVQVAFGWAFGESILPAAFATAVYWIATLFV